MSDVTTTSTPAATRPSLLHSPVIAALINGASRIVAAILPRLLP